MSLSIELAPSDTLTVQIRNVSVTATGAAVTSGLVGTVSILDGAGSVVAGPSSLALVSGSTWGANVVAPASRGVYTIAVAYDANGAHKTSRGTLTLT